MNYAILPSIKVGYGTAHLKRSVKIAEGIGPEAKIYIPFVGMAGYFDLDTIKKIVGIQNFRRHFDILHIPLCATILLDQRKTPSDIFDTCRKYGPVIAIDEGNVYVQDRADYSIDTLPRKNGKSRAAIYSPGFLDLPERSYEPRKGVLVTFGGEDPDCLTERLLEKIVPEFFKPEEVTVIFGPAAKKQRVPAGVEVIGYCNNMPERLAKAELVFCSFGLTAYESCASGTPVILLNNSRYHQSLSRVAGFPEIGVIRPGVKKLKSFIKDREGLEKMCSFLFHEQRLSLGAYIKSLKLR